jgi:hypothetical protein
MLRAISSFKPQSILASYVVVSIAIILVPIYYLWESCRIDEEYFGVNTDYFCNPDSARMLGAFLVFSPVVLILYAPVIVGGILAALRRFRAKMSALSVQTAVSILTVLTVWSSILIAFSALFSYDEDRFYREVQCDFADEEPMPCLKGTARADLSGVLAPVEIALCVVSIGLSLIYRFYY